MVRVDRKGVSDTATPDSAEFWDSHKATEDTLRTLRRRFVVVVLVGAAFVIAALSIFLIKTDAKFSATEADVHSVKVTVHKIRDTQVRNTNRNDALAVCQVTTGDDFIFDILRLVATTPTPTTGYKVPMDCAAALKTVGSK